MSLLHYFSKAWPYKTLIPIAIAMYAVLVPPYACKYLFMTVHLTIQLPFVSWCQMIVDGVGHSGQLLSHDISSLTGTCLESQL